MYYMQNLKSMNCVLLLDHKYCPGDVPAYQKRGEEWGWGENSEVCFGSSEVQNSCP